MLAAVALWWLADGGGAAQPMRAPRAMPSIAPEVLPAATALPVASLAEPSTMPLLEAASSALDSPMPAGSRDSWHGRLLWPDGSLAADVPWHLVAFGTSPVPLETRGVTGSDGRFDVVIGAQDRLNVSLAFEPAGGVQLEFSGTTSLADSEEDLGDVRLSAPFTVRGVVVGDDGSPLAAPWQVIVSRHADRAGDGPQRSEDASVACDPATGRFEIRGVAPGRHVTFGRLFEAGGRFGSTVLLETESREIDVSADVADLSLVCHGPDPRRQLVVLVSGAGGRPCLDVEPEHVTLRGPQGALAPPRSVRSERMLIFDDVPPGSYALEIRDPAHEPWLATGVQPGLEPVRAELTGSCTLDLSVVESGSGAPIDTFRVTATVERPTWSLSDGKPAYMRQLSAMFDPELVPLGAHPGGRVVIRGLSTDALMLDVTAPGFAPLTSESISMRPGGVTRLRTEMRRVGGIGGRVRRADGSPAARVPVGIFPVKESDSPSFVTRDEDEWLEGHLWGWDYELASTISDEQGRFRFEALAPRTYRVRAWLSSVVDAFATFEIGDGLAPDDVELTLPASVALEGRLTSQGAAPDRRWGLALVCAGNQVRAGQTLFPIATAATDGRFRFEALPPGRWHVFARADSDHWLPYELYVPTSSAPCAGSFRWVDAACAEDCAYLGCVEAPAGRNQALVLDVAVLAPP
jgi:hypothetical protein